MTSEKKENKLGLSSAKLPTSVGVAVGRHSGGRLTMMLVNRYLHHSFLPLFHFFSVTISNRMTPGFKSVFLQMLK